MNIQSIEKPNACWATDITYIPTGEGWLYLAGVMDQGSRRILGMAFDSRLDASLCLAALRQALGAQPQQRQRLIHHSDQGSQGGINWSSQHNREECCDGRETAVGSSVTGQVEVARAAGDDTAYRHYWELCVLLALQGALRSGEVRRRLQVIYPSLSWEQIKARHPSLVRSWPPDYEPRPLVEGEAASPESLPKNERPRCYR